MSMLSIEFEKEFNEIIKQLMRSQYPDVQINGSKYHIPSKSLSVDIRRDAFYFDLDISKYHKVQNFKGYGSIRRGIWYFPTLKFEIMMAANSGRTYSYPRLRKMKVENEDDLILFANYMFSCVNMAIKFFDYEYRKATETNFENPMDGLFTYNYSEGIIL